MSSVLPKDMLTSEGAREQAINILIVRQPCYQAATHVIHCLGIFGIFPASSFPHFMAWSKL